MVLQQRALQFGVVEVVAAVCVQRVKCLAQLLDCRLTQSCPLALRVRSIQDSVLTELSLVACAGDLWRHDRLRRRRAAAQPVEHNVSGCFESPNCWSQKISSLKEWLNLVNELRAAARNAPEAVE